MTEVIKSKVAVIGSGMGGGMISRALAERGLKVAIFERGYRLPREKENRDAGAIFVQNRYKNAGTWYDRNGKPFLPGVHYYVGGNTKLYGASLIRFSESDFRESVAAEGISPAWPFSYADLEKYYGQAESALKVNGNAGADPFASYRSTEYDKPALEHEPNNADFAKSLKRSGVSPYPMAIGVDYGPGGKCVRCIWCDGYPCLLGAKSDGETCGVDPALATGNASLYEGFEIERLIHDETGRKVIAAIARRSKDNTEIRIKADFFILSAGAANSPKILINSKSDKHPNGLANSSGLVGKNWMVHNATFVVGIRPWKRNTTQFQKTISFNDWYEKSKYGYPLGNVQMLGRLQWQHFQTVAPYLPKFFLKWLSDHSIDVYTESEDLPDENNKVTFSDDGKIFVHWTPNNLIAHKNLVKETKKLIRRAGYPFVFTLSAGIETNSHMCGTLRAGNDPQKSVLNQYCKAHDLDNLFVVDSSFFPSSGGANPALTIAAQAYRVADLGGIK